MKLHASFIKLPFVFDVERLQAEIATFKDEDWIPNPGKLAGNSCIPLISVLGEIGHATSGPMRLTKHLERSPYLKQIFAKFNCVYGRSRLMRLDGHSQVPLHSDVNYHWHNRVRIHIPIITTPDVFFHCGDDLVHMAEGEAWIFDSWKLHRVENKSDNRRVHLVIDTCGSAEFWDMVSKSETVPLYQPNSITRKKEFVKFDGDNEFLIQTENYNTPIVMSPGEVDSLIDELILDVASNTKNNSKDINSFVKQLKSFKFNWRELWSIYADKKQGWPEYQSLVSNMLKLNFNVTMGTIDVSAQQVFVSKILNSVINVNLDDMYSSINRDNAKLKAISSHMKTATTEIESENINQKKIIDTKQNRNSLCGCGSGLKHKYCCGKLS